LGFVSSNRENPEDFCKFSFQLKDLDFLPFGEAFWPENTFLVSKWKQFSLGNPKEVISGKLHFSRKRP